MNNEQISKLLALVAVSHMTRAEKLQVLQILGVKDIEFTEGLK